MFCEISKFLFIMVRGISNYNATFARINFENMPRIRKKKKEINKWKYKKFDLAKKWETVDFSLKRLELNNWTGR